MDSLARRGNFRAIKIQIVTLPTVDRRAIIRWGFGISVETFESIALRVKIL